jgi:hypothetical protein
VDSPFLLYAVALFALLPACAHADSQAGDGGGPPADATSSDATNGAPDAPSEAPPDAAGDGADAGDGGGDAALDVSNLPIGWPCTLNSQCEGGICQDVHNGDASVASLCVMLNCSPFNPCPPGSTCYGDVASQVCVFDCSTGQACPPGLTCLTTYMPSKGCLPP